MTWDQLRRLAGFKLVIALLPSMRSHCMTRTSWTPHRLGLQLLLSLSTLALSLTRLHTHLHTDSTVCVAAKDLEVPHTPS